MAIARVIRSQHGIQAPGVILSSVCRYLQARFSPDKGSFAFCGRKLPYCLDIHNQAFANERTVEVPIALTWFPLAGDILEIGNVLGQYATFARTVVDKYERDERVLNIDIVDYAPGRTFDLILSVSTFEHIGFDEDPKDPDKVDAAVRKAKSLLKPGGRFLMTVPINWNPGLDAKLARLGFTAIHYLRRVNAANAWAETSAGEALGLSYGHPFPAANAVAVCLFES
jgi:SAM-dependent methyltransferase